MAASDATPVPVKGQAYRLTVPIWDADGDLVTGAGSLDSEVSKDGGAFADCTNEATEIATASGVYYLDLTSSEMNADTVAVLIKSATGKTTPVILYPAEAADIPVNVTAGAATIAGAVWDAATVDHDDAGTYGERINDTAGGIAAIYNTVITNLDAAVSSRASQTSLDTVDDLLDTEIAAIAAATAGIASAAAIADAVWDEALSGHATAGTAGAALSAAGAAGDPWAVELPGDYADGTAGAAVGEILDLVLTDATTATTNATSSEGQDFEMYAGDTRTITIEVSDGGGALVDLTGAAIVWGLYSATAPATILITKEVGDGIAILTQSGATLGQFRITLDPADTISLQGDYQHEAEVTDGAGNVSTVTTGTATIKPSRV